MSNYQEHGWSPIIYGRTYEVDFRLLTIPEYFNKEDSNWAIKYILETTKMPEKLSESPRWSLVNDRDYYLFGITCNVRQLLQNREVDSNRLIFDSKGRPIYAFVGYVTQKGSQNSLPILPQYEDLQMADFQSRYIEYIERCWDVKNYQIESKQPLLSVPTMLNFSTGLTSEDTPIVLNTERDKIGIWSSESNANLWNSIVRFINKHPDLPLSVGLNLPKISSIESTAFLNVSSSQWESGRNGELIIKPKPKPEKPLTPLPAVFDDWDDRLENTRDRDWDESDDLPLSSSLPPDRYSWTIVDILREIQRRRLEFPHLDRELKQVIWFYWFNQKNKIQDFSNCLVSFNPLKIVDFVAEEIEQLLGNFNPNHSLQDIARVLDTEVCALRIAIEAGVQDKTKAEIENLFNPLITLDRDRPKVNPSLGFKPSQDLPSPPNDRAKEDWF